jgi:hypothetical protein
MSTSERMESFERGVIARLSGIKKILPNAPLIHVNAHLDTGKVSFELPQATSGIRIEHDLAARLADSLDKAGMALIEKFPLPSPMPLGLDHLPVKVDVARDRRIQLEFQQRTAGVEMEAWQAIQLGEVIRRAARLVIKLERKQRTR